MSHVLKFKLIVVLIEHLDLTKYYLDSFSH